MATANYGWDIGTEGLKPWWDEWEALWTAVDAEFYTRTKNLLMADYTITGAGDFTTKGPWVDARAFATIEAANTYAFDNGKVLLIASNWTLTANTILTANIRCISGGTFTKASTYTLTINGHLEAGNETLFIGFSAGEVTFGPGSISELKLEWFGFSTTAVGADNKASWDCAVGSVPLIYFAYGMVMSASPGTYTMAGQAIIDKALRYWGRNVNLNFTTELMTLDVAATPADFAPGVTVHGDTSGATCVIVSKITSTTYWVKTRTGNFTLGEILHDGTNSADQGPTRPIFGNLGIGIIASNVELDDPISTGPQFVDYHATQIGISAYGTDNNPAAPTYISGFKIIDGKITNWGRTGIKFKFVEDFEITGVRIEDIIYVGISLNSSKNGRVHHNKIKNMDVYSGLAYGITCSKDSNTGTNGTTNPQSRDILIDHNDIYDVEGCGLDTHAGMNITIDHNLVQETQGGIHGQTVEDTDGNHFTLTNFKVIGNTLITTLTDPSYGIWNSGDVHDLAYYTQNTIIANNIVSGYGHEAGAICDYISSRTIIKGNIVINPGAFGIYMFRDSLDFIVSDNEVYGMKVAHAFAAIGINNVGTQRGMVTGNSVDGNSVALYGIANDYLTTYTDVTIRDNRVKNCVTANYRGLTATNWEHYADNADHTTVADGEDTLQSMTLWQNQFSADMGLKIEAAGTKTQGGTHGNKTLKFYLGVSTITFHAAADNTNDWTFKGELWFTGVATQRFKWEGTDGSTLLKGYEEWTEDISAGDLLMKITGTCADAADTITGDFFTVDRIYGNQ